MIISNSLKGMLFVFITSIIVTAVCFAEEVTLTTIMPRQDVLRIKNGVIGNLDHNGDGDYTDSGEWAFEDVSEDIIGDNNLLVAGYICIGSTFAEADFQVTSNSDEHTSIRLMNTESAPGIWEFRTYQNHSDLNNGFSIWGGAEGTFADRFTINKHGNYGLGTSELPTGGGPALVFAEGSDPTGIANNTAGLFAKKTSGTCHLWAFAEDGSTQQLTPHDPVTGEWIFFSKNIKTGKVMRVNMEKLVRKVEELTGEKFLEEWYEK